MTTKLIQKQFLKGTREFEIVGDTVLLRIKSPLKQEKSTLGLSILKPDPVVNGAELEFHGRGNSGALLSLLLDKPDRETFNAFVDTLRQRLLEEGDDFAESSAGLPEATRDELIQRNVFEEPPAFSQTERSQQAQKTTAVNVERLDEDITMLKTYLAEEDIQPFLLALEALKAEPQSDEAFARMVDAFNELGFYQGSVLTYATYLKVLLSNNLFSE